MANVARRPRLRRRGLERNQLLESLGRFGDACYGVVHLVVAWLALQVAFGTSTGAADQRGAVTDIAAQPYGQLLLWALAIGLLSFGAWQFLVAANGYRWIRDQKKRTRKRLGSAARAVAVLLIAITTLRLVLSGSSGSGSGNAQPQEFTARLLALPFGRVLVAAVAAVVVVSAAITFRRGLRKSFLEDLDTAPLSAGARRWVTRLGQFGYEAKAVAYAVIGILLFFAAGKGDPGQAGGLDKALRTMAAQPFGVVLLIVVAVGFAAYGAYCFADARCRRN